MPDPDEKDQIRKDRRALLKGSLIAGAAGVGALALLRKGAGGVVRDVTTHRGVSLPAPKARVVREPKVTATKPVIRLRGESGVKSTAIANNLRKGGQPRLVKAATLKEQRAYDALKPTTTKKLMRGTPAEREKFGKLDAAARSAKAKDQGSLVTHREQSVADRGARQRARQDLLQYRKQKRFMTPASQIIQFGERSSTARDAAVGAGALAAGGSAVYAARQLGKTSKATTRAANATTRAAKAATTASARFTPREVANAVGAEVQAKTRKTLKSYFPTFIKGGKKVSALMKAHVFETPASRLIDFGNDEQWKEASTRRYGSALKGAAGMQRGFFRKNANGDPIIEDIPIAHAQVLKSAYNKGKKIQRTASRGGALAKDVVNVARGKPREKDAAGRTKKREWEKSWFKNTVRDVAAGGALLGGAVLLRKKPKLRAAVQSGIRKAGDAVNSVIPDAVKHNFSTPASALFGKAEKVVRGTRFGKFLGPSKQAVKVQAQREALGKRLSKMPGKDAARVGRKVVRDAALKKDVINNATTAQKAAIRGVKRGAAIAGSGAVLGAAATKAYTDQPEDSKVHQGARVRNALVGAAAGSFLGAGLHAGKSGFRGARVGALLGGVSGLVANPKRKQVIEDLPLASFATPASRLLHFDAVAADAGWDVRDPRGKSARVFAPGSRQRVRRPKEWYEKTDNERKLWKAGLLAAGLAGVAGGAAVGRHFPKAPKAAVESAASKVFDGPWKKSG